MKWMKERDLLIAQTMSFVQSVTGRKPDAALADAPFAGAGSDAEAASIAAVKAALDIVDAPVAPQGLSRKFRTRKFRTRKFRK